jgi:hypothetical protein
MELKTLQDEEDSLMRVGRNQKDALHYLNHNTEYGAALSEVK